MAAGGVTVRTPFAIRRSGNGTGDARVGEDRDEVADVGQRDKPRLSVIFSISRGFAAGHGRSRSIDAVPARQPRAVDDDFVADESR